MDSKYLLNMVQANLRIMEDEIIFSAEAGNEEERERARLICRGINIAHNIVGNALEAVIYKTNDEFDSERIAHERQVELYKAMKAGECDERDFVPRQTP